MINVNDLKQAHIAGMNWANGLKVGDRFLGASPAALALGYQRNSMEHRLFVNAALDVLMNLTLHTTMDDQNIITKIGSRS